jgi:glyoxalase family protein
MRTVTGLHHITAISGSAQENLDFYAGVLGMRLVKKSVNQDDPGTYHLFYADGAGTPGADLTFFPWEQLAPARPGHGLTSEVLLAIPPGTLPAWGQRLARHGVMTADIEIRFGEPTLPFVDPHGLRVALVESAGALSRAFVPWHESSVPVAEQIRGLHGARIRERNVATTAGFLTETLGLRLLGSEAGWDRYAGEGTVSGGFLDLAEAPTGPRGAWGIGAVHHLAWRVDDAEHQRQVRAQVEVAGQHPTPEIDRFWFRSVYFKEPGGVLFELATDGPGFAIDEAPGHLGETLILPPWLEPQRREIEAALPPLTRPRNVA